MNKSALIQVFISIFLISSCTSVQQRDYTPELTGLNDLDLCYIVYFDPFWKSRYSTQFSNILYTDEDRRQAAANQIIQSRKFECPLLELSKLHEMRKQTAALEAQAKAQRKQQKEIEEQNSKRDRFLRFPDSDSN